MPDPIARLMADPPDLPVVAGLEELTRALTVGGGAAVVQAPPGTGKTTLVPPAVALLGAGRVVVTQPRRIAVRAAARRLAQLLGEPVGGTVGYAVRGERLGGPEIRVEFVTTGLLLRRLQRDPELAGVAAVVLDEVHERQLDADLALALLVDVRAHLRPDLRLVAMSATVEAERTAVVLAGPPSEAGPEPTLGPVPGPVPVPVVTVPVVTVPVVTVPVVTVPGALHPVRTHWCPLPPRVRRSDERGVTPGFLRHVAACARRALSEQPGDVLVFLPGVAEVDAVVRLLGATGSAGGLAGHPSTGDVEVLALHGRLPATEQDRVLGQPSPTDSAGRRRVVVSTAVAESSLTVPGVRSVVDAGLSREPRTDHGRGLAGLVTVRVSRASAEQRAGRAGREAPGAVYRCWSESEDAHLAALPDPEIAVADLTGFALELAVWGVPGGTGLALLDPPPAAALAAATGTLVGLGALDEHGAATQRGRRIAGVPTDPRLARALLDGAPLVGARRAAEVVALLDEDTRAPGADLVAALRGRRQGGPHAATWRSAVRRLEDALRRSDPAPGRPVAAEPAQALGDEHAVGVVVALAHPDRVARRRPGATAYLMVSGTAAVLPHDRGGRPGAGLAGTTWLAVADVERTPGRPDALIRSAAPLDEDLALEAASARWHEEDLVEWAQGRLSARRVTRLGAIELTSVPLTSPSAPAVAAALREGLRRDGLTLLPWSAAATALRRRLGFLHAALGEPWPAVDDDALLEGLESWLGPELARVRTARDLARIDVLSGLRRLLPWPAAGRLDELAPVRVGVPSGSTVAVDYDADQPVLAVRLQECFGWTQTPRVADGRVPVLLHLLSPARRPVAVTADLASFWATGYPQVRAELRGRYPKHAWPEDPWTAPPTRGTSRGSGGAGGVPPGARPRR